MKKYVCLFILMLSISPAIFSQESSSPAQLLINNTTISGEFFLGFNYDNQKEMSAFILKRGYFTIKTKLNDVLSVRYTQDITTDREGGDMGNIEMRLKYLYLKVDLKKTDILHNTYFEFGMVHRPWLDFEQKINGYRVQGRMFTDRYNLTSSAGFGITYAGLIGGKIDQDYQDRISSDYPGRLGSFALGVYNGGGYHSLERNNNKIIEGRLTLRPLPVTIPGVQLSYTFSYGKTNTVLNNGDYRLNLLYLSSESQYYKLMGTLYSGKGSYDDEYMDRDGYSYRNNGYSIFGEVYIPGTKMSLFSRYDKFVVHEADDVEQNTYIAGVTYRFLGNKVLLDYDRNKKPGVTTRIYEVALEINF